MDTCFPISGYVLLFLCINYIADGAPLGPLTEPIGTPICAQQNSLCDVSLDLRSLSGMTKGLTYKSPQPICSCPGGVQCPRGNTTDYKRVIQQRLESPDQEVIMTLSYCTPLQGSFKECGENEVSMRLRGLGILFYELEGDVKCRCQEPLYLHRTEPQGIFRVQEYACKKPLCDVNQSYSPVCHNVTNTQGLLGPQLVSNTPCLCPDGFTCNVDPQMIPIYPGGTQSFHCQVQQ